MILSGYIIPGWMHVEFPGHDMSIRQEVTLKTHDRLCGTSIAGIKKYSDNAPFLQENRTWPSLFLHSFSRFTFFANW